MIGVPAFVRRHWHSLVDKVDSVARQHDDRRRQSEVGQEWANVSPRDARRERQFSCRGRDLLRPRPLVCCRVDFYTPWIKIDNDEPAIENVGVVRQGEPAMNVEHFVEAFRREVRDPPGSE